MLCGLLLQQFPTVYLQIAIAQKPDIEELVVANLIIEPVEYDVLHAATNPPLIVVLDVVEESQSDEKALSNDDVLSGKIQSQQV